MSRIRSNGTIRTLSGTESKICERCREEKDIVNFHPYWYQPKRAGKPFGEKIRRRTANCYDCRIKTFEPPQIRYFQEKSTEDKIKHDKEWDEVKDRMIFLQDGIDATSHEKYFLEEVKRNGKTHDMVGIRFPDFKFLLESRVLKQMKEGKPIGSDRWLPSEIWIYSPSGAWPGHNVAGSPLVTG